MSKKGTYWFPVIIELESDSFESAEETVKAFIHLENCGCSIKGKTLRFEMISHDEVVPLDPDEHKLR